MEYNPVNTYLQEAEELLAEIEEASLALDAGPVVPELVNRLFRAFHTIKGSGAMCGFDAVARFTHHVESALDRVRQGALAVTPKLIELVLAAKDEIRALLALGPAEGGIGSAPDGAAADLIALFAGLVASDADVAPSERLQPGDSAQHDGRPNGQAAIEQTWRIVFRPNPNLLAFGGNPAALIEDLRQLGECRVLAHTGAIPALDEAIPDTCYLWWTMTLRTASDRNAIRDAFLFVEDGATIEIEPVSNDAENAGAVETSAAQEDAAVRQATKTAPEVRAAATNSALSKESTVRVPAERLDRLVGLVGELVMNQSRLAQAASQVNSTELAGPVEEIERLVAELRDDVLGIRMMPIGTIFNRFRRLVHDLSSELGKEIDLVVEGAETELDKSILDQIGEPLVHLIRNSIDHGVEIPEQRVKAGKPERGTIRLLAVHTGSDVLVEVEDDGGGLDRSVIRNKALEKRLISPDANLSDKEVLNLILLPGFSTASAVTSISGRGVGMDVVKKQIDALRGSIAISSEAGRWTRIALRLPLTLAIIDGLLVEVGRARFIVPLSAVAENVELSQAERERRNGRNLTAVRGELIPYIDLRTAFRLGGEPPPLQKIVIVHHDEQRVGLVVDRVLGTHQTVIQSLGRFFRNIEVASGSTVMGDGRVALILDVRAVVRFVEHEKESFKAR